MNTHMHALYLAYIYDLCPYDSTIFYTYCVESCLLVAICVMWNNRIAYCVT